MFFLNSNQGKMKLVFNMIKVFTSLKAWDTSKSNIYGRKYWNFSAFNQYQRGPVTKLFNSISILCQRSFIGHPTFKSLNERSKVILRLQSENFVSKFCRLKLQHTDGIWLLLHASIGLFTSDAVYRKRSEPMCNPKRG